MHVNLCKFYPDILLTQKQTIYQMKTLIVLCFLVADVKGEGVMDYIQVSRVVLH